MELKERKLRHESGIEFKLYHLCYYLSKSSMRDNYQKLILDFKRGEENAVRRCIIEAIENLQKLSIDEDTMILRALGGNETKGDQYLSKGLYRLGVSLSWVFNCDHFPGIIYKKKISEPLKSLGIKERKAALEGVYAADNNITNLNGRKVLLIDDVVTTGTTVCAIISAILKIFPETKIEVFALAWTPTREQQICLEQQQNEMMFLNEPEAGYGGLRGSGWVDQDFEKGETNISFL